MGRIDLWEMTEEEKEKELRDWRDDLSRRQEAAIEAVAAILNEDEKWLFLSEIEEAFKRHSFEEELEANCGRKPQFNIVAFLSDLLECEGRAKELVRIFDQAWLDSD